MNIINKRLFIRNFSIFKKSKEIKLGRWERTGSIDIKVDLANHDSCGGPHCGNPPQSSKYNKNNKNNKNNQIKNLNVTDYDYYRLFLM